jgi:hypothetical protein
LRTHGCRQYIHSTAAKYRLDTPGRNGPRTVAVMMVNTRVLYRKKEKNVVMKKKRRVRKSSTDVESA